VEAAEAAGLTPVKINVVVVRGFNHDEVLDFARLTLEAERHIRFIEVMPLGQNELWAEDGFVSMKEVRERIEAAFGPLEQVGRDAPIIGNGPARYWRLGSAAGTLGFISPVSEHFCSGCNRLRLTADGRLRPCLLSDSEIDLCGPLRTGIDDVELERLITDAAVHKPSRHHLDRGEHPVNREMAQIGG
jgi:cyclic pyranopterin phosphate synthase